MVFHIGNSAESMVGVTIAGIILKLIDKLCTKYCSPEVAEAAHEIEVAISEHSPHTPHIRPTHSQTSLGSHHSHQKSKNMHRTITK